MCEAVHDEVQASPVLWLCWALCWKEGNSKPALLLPLTVLHTWQQQKAVHNELQVLCCQQNSLGRKVLAGTLRRQWGPQ